MAANKDPKGQKEILSDVPLTGSAAIDEQIDQVFKGFTSITLLPTIRLSFGRGNSSSKT